MLADAQNLTRMSAAFGAALADSAFQADDVLASVIAALEQCVQQLCSASSGNQQQSPNSEVALATTLKFLRLYWRAFQGQLLCYLSVLTSEVGGVIVGMCE